jgi:hypothetical protein
MAGLVPPARPKPLRRGEGPAITSYFTIVSYKSSHAGLLARINRTFQARANV